MTPTFRTQREFAGLPSAKEMKEPNGDYLVFVTFRRWKNFSSEDKTLSAVIKAVSKFPTFAAKWDNYEREECKKPTWGTWAEHQKVDGFFDEMMAQYPARGFYMSL